jgi:hypothetical protein
MGVTGRPWSGGVARNTSSALHASSSSGFGVQLRGGAEQQRLALSPLLYMVSKWMKPHRVGVTTRAGDGGKSGENLVYVGTGDATGEYSVDDIPTRGGPG